MAGGSNPSGPTVTVSHALVVLMQHTRLLPVEERVQVPPSALSHKHPDRIRQSLRLFQDRPTVGRESLKLAMVGSTPSPGSDEAPAWVPPFFDNLTGQDERPRVAPGSPSPSPSLGPKKYWTQVCGKARSSVAYEGKPGIAVQPRSTRRGAQNYGPPIRIAQP